MLSRLYRATIFITVHGARSEKHDLIYHGPHNSRRRVMLASPFGSFERELRVRQVYEDTRRCAHLDIPLGSCVFAKQLACLKKIALLRER